MHFDISFFYNISSYYHFFFFFFNDTATTEIYTLSLHDALPIYLLLANRVVVSPMCQYCAEDGTPNDWHLVHLRSEEHTSELQSQSNLVCRLLLEKKKKRDVTPSIKERSIRYL